MKTLRQFEAKDSAYNRAQTRALLRQFEAGRYRLCQDGIMRYGQRAADRETITVPPSSRRNPK